MMEPDVPPNAETKTKIPAKALWLNFSVFDNTVELTKGYNGARNRPIKGNKNDTKGSSAIDDTSWLGTLLAIGITTNTKIAAATSPKEAI